MIQSTKHNTPAIFIVEGVQFIDETFKLISFDLSTSSEI